MTSTPRVRAASSRRGSAPAADRPTNTHARRSISARPPAPTPPRQIHTHARAFNGPFSGTTRVSRYLKGKTSLDFSEARDSEWQWHQLGHMQVCTSLQTDNNARTPPLPVFYRPGALPAAQRTASKHRRQMEIMEINKVNTSLRTVRSTP